MSVDLKIAKEEKHNNNKRKASASGIKKDVASKRHKLTKEKKSSIKGHETLKEVKDDESNTETKPSTDPSKRQLKKEKAIRRALEAKESKSKEVAKKCLNYISKWKHSKNEWKFEKLKQIWLIDNLLNEHYVPDEFFPLILEYFQGAGENCKRTLAEKCMSIVNKVEESIENDEFEETVEYKRARQLVQTIPYT